MFSLSSCTRTHHILSITSSTAQTTSEPSTFREGDKWTRSKSQWLFVRKWKSDKFHRLYYFAPEFRCSTSRHVFLSWALGQWRHFTIIVSARGIPHINYFLPIRGKFGNTKIFSISKFFNFPSFFPPFSFSHFVLSSSTSLVWMSSLLQKKGRHKNHW